MESKEFIEVLSKQQYSFIFDAKKYLNFASILMNSRSGMIDAMDDMDFSEQSDEISLTNPLSRTTRSN
jgi:hypothetical protein